MAPLLYPELAWPARFGRFIRTLQIVAIAGAIGALAGSTVVLTLTDTGAPHKPVIVGAGGDKAEKALTAAKAAGDSNGALQSAAPAVASPAPPAASPLSGAPQPQQPAAVPPESGTPQAPQLAAAAPQLAGPAGAPAAAGLYNRVEPAQHSAHSRSVKLRAKENRRTKSPAWRYARERDRGTYEPYGSTERRASEGDIQTGFIQRGGYPYYNAAPRSNYWGGGPSFGGGWGGGWGNN